MYIRFMFQNLNLSPKIKNSYRYGFQGQEVDNEVKGNGMAVNYKYRMHDPRLGRFFAVDPLTHEYPHYSPYQFSGNKLIHMVELEGLEPATSGSGSATPSTPTSGGKFKVERVPTKQDPNLFMITITKVEEDVQTIAADGISASTTGLIVEYSGFGATEDGTFDDFKASSYEFDLMHGSGLDYIIQNANSTNKRRVSGGEHHETFNVKGGPTLRYIPKGPTGYQSENTVVESHFFMIDVYYKMDKTKFNASEAANYAATLSEINTIIQYAQNNLNLSPNVPPGGTTSPGGYPFDNKQIIIYGYHSPEISPYESEILDSQGNVRTGNNALAQDRALYMAKYLISNGVNANIIHKRARPGRGIDRKSSIIIGSH